MDRDVPMQGGLEDDASFLAGLDGPPTTPAARHRGHPLSGMRQYNVRRQGERLTRADAFLIVLRSLMDQHRAMIDSPDLRKVVFEAHVGKDGSLRVVLFAPTFARQTSEGGLSAR